jgi:hypothetical protein
LEDLSGVSAYSSFFESLERCRLAPLCKYLPSLHTVFEPSVTPLRGHHVVVQVEISLHVWYILSRTCICGSHVQRICWSDLSEVGLSPVKYLHKVANNGTIQLFNHL